MKRALGVRGFGRKSESMSLVEEREGRQMKGKAGPKRGRGNSVGAGRGLTKGRREGKGRGGGAGGAGRGEGEH